MLRANAIYEGTYLLGTSIARPLIAKQQIEIAHRRRRDAVCHGATGKGNDQVRFELTYMALDPDIKIIAPWRENGPSRRGRTLIDYAAKHRIPVPVTKDKPYSIGPEPAAHLLRGRHPRGPLDRADRGHVHLIRSPEEAPDKPTYVEIEFEKGNPVAVNGKKMSPATLLEHLNTIGGANGIGRVDMVENRFVGMKSRGVYETPGGTILRAAHRAVESITMDREVMHLRDGLIPKYAQLVYNGFWYSPGDEGPAAVHRRHPGERRRARRGSSSTRATASSSGASRRTRSTARTSPPSRRATVYEQKDATGFIRLNALRLRIAAYLRKKKGK